MNTRRNVTIAEPTTSDYVETVAGGLSTAIAHPQHGPYLGDTALPIAGALEKTSPVEPSIETLDMPSESSSVWKELIGQEVVVDASSPFVYLGRLAAERNGYLILEDADAHDLRDTSTTRDRYILDSRTHGIHVNRRRVWVNLREVVAVSLLRDVIDT